MSEAVASGRIGPNAILQLLPVLDDLGGPGLARRILAEGGLTAPPAPEGMIDEKAVAATHRALRRVLPDQAATLAAEAGRRTADYILAHRIPMPAQRVLKCLPRGLAERLLVQAIARHAWTFAGSGRFRVLRRRPPVFEIAGNPIVLGERAAAPLCHWHAAVFERLFRVLVDPEACCMETACAAAGAPACRFEIVRP